MTDTTNMTDEQYGRHIEATVLSAPSGAKLVGNDNGYAAKQLSALPPLTGLPPAMADSIRAQLANTPLSIRDSEEARLIREHLQENSLNVRVMAGVGKDANPYQREMFSISNETYELAKTEQWYIDQLAEMTDRFDRETGKPVPRIQGHQRAEYEAEIRRLKYQQSLLNGPERAKRLDDAMAQTKAERHAKLEALKDRAEADRRAVEIAREKRIQRDAEAKAAWMDNSL